MKLYQFETFFGVQLKHCQPSVFGFNSALARRAEQLHALPGRHIAGRCGVVCVVWSVRMKTDRESRVTGALFLGFLGAGAVALAAAYLVLGRLIIDASAGEGGAMMVIAGGALVGTLTAVVIHEVGHVLPRVTQKLNRG
jgi:hypothetical protein